MLAIRVEEQRQLHMQEEERKRVAAEKRLQLWDELKSSIGLDERAEESVLWMIKVFAFRDTHILQVNKYFAEFNLLRNARVLTFDSVQGETTPFLLNTSDLLYLGCKVTLKLI